MMLARKGPIFFNLELLQFKLLIVKSKPEVPSSTASLPLSLCMDIYRTDLKLIRVKAFVTHWSHDQECQGGSSPSTQRGHAKLEELGLLDDNRLNL